MSSACFADGNRIRRGQIQAAAARVRRLFAAPEASVVSSPRNLPERAPDSTVDRAADALKPGFGSACSTNMHSASGAAAGHKTKRFAMTVSSRTLFAELSEHDRSKRHYPPQSHVEEHGKDSESDSVHSRILKFIKPVASALLGIRIAVVCAGQQADHHKHLMDFRSFRPRPLR